MERLRKVFGCLFLFVLVAGCRAGNGDGYPGMIPHEDPSKPMSGIYYWIDPDYRCHPAGGGPLISSYRGAMRIEAGVRTYLGDLCHPTETLIAESEPLDYWGAAEVVGYRQGIYERRQAVPKTSEPFVGIWCRQPDSKNQLAIRMFPETDDPVVKLSLTGSNLPNEFSVKKTITNQTREFERSGFHLIVHVGMDIAAVPQKSTAELVSSVGMVVAQTHTLECRVTPTP